ncbi:MAG: HIT family protein [Actinomycetota bacterium]
MKPPDDCLACQARAGKIRLNPAPEIYSGEHWIVEHIEPTDILGWVVLATREHRHAMHDLVPAEWAEVTSVLPALCQAIRNVTGCEKEYLAQFAEQDGFNHVHIHVIPRMPTWPVEWRGFSVSSAIGKNAKQPISAERMSEFALRLKAELERLLG